MRFSWEDIKRTLVKEIKPIFDDPAQPRYPFSFEDGLDVFCKTLLYKTGDVELDGMADKILPTIDKYYHHKSDLNDAFNYLTQISTKLDSFLQKIVSLFHNANYLALKSARKGMFHFVRASGINKNTIDFSKALSTIPPADLTTNFGLQLYEAYKLRNTEAHTATDYRSDEISNYIRHTLTVYIYTVFEYYNQLTAVVNGIIIPPYFEIFEIVKELTPPREYDVDLANVVGRESEMQDLVNLKRSDKILFVRGIGGIGKTTLTKAYIKSTKQQYNHLLWIQFQSSFQNSFNNNISLIQNLNLRFTDTVTEKEKLETILNSLRKLPGKNLVLIDNLQEDDINNLNLLPYGENWDVIISSKLKLNYALLIPYEVGILNFDNSKNLFKKYYSGNVVDAELQALLSLVSYHTLSIELLAKTLETNFTIGGIPGIITHLKNETINDEDWQVLIKAEQTDEELNLKNHLIKTFNISDLNEYEKQILLHFSVLPAMALDGLELVKIFDIKDKQRFVDTLNALDKKGWIIKSDRTFSIHNIIQEVVKIKIPPTSENCKDVIFGINNLLDSSIETSIKEKARYVLLAESVLSIVKSDDEEIFYLNVLTGIAFKDIGNAQSGLNFLISALNIARKTSNSVLLAQVLSPLGIAYRLTGQLEKSIEAYKEAISIIEKSEEKNYVMLQVYTNYATLLEQLGTKENLLEAKALYEFAIEELKECIKEFGVNRFLETLSASTKGSLGKVYSILGDYPRAIQLQQESYNELLKTEDNQFYISISANNLGLSYGNNKMYDESMKYHKIAVEIQEKILPENHPDLSISKSGLANAYYLSGNKAKAKEIFKEVLKIGEANYHKDHPVMARRKSNLAAVCDIPEEIELAKSLYIDAIAIDTIHYTRDNPSVALNLFNLSMLYLKENNRTEAIPILKEAFRTFNKHYGVTHEFTKNALIQLMALGIINP